MKQSMKRIARWMTLGVGLAAVIGLMAASASDGETDSSQPPMAVEADEADEAIAELVAHAPPDQQVASDGSVSVDDYRLAVDETVECLRARIAAHGFGVDVDTPRLSEDGYEYLYQYEVAPRPDGSSLGPAVVSEIDRSCQAQFLQAIEGVFQLQLRSEADYADDVTDQLRNCLREAGVAPDEDGGARDLAAEAVATPNPDSVDSVNACISAAPSVTDVLPTETDLIGLP